MSGAVESEEETKSLEEIEEELIDALSAFVDDPLGFVEFAFDWGSGDLDEQDGPDDWQRDILEAIGERTLKIEEALRIAVASGHGVGKSALVAWIVLWMMSCRPHLNGVVTANTKTQLDGKTWRELSLWHKRAINAHWFTWTATKFYHNESPETWFVQSVPWSKTRPEAFAGLHGEHVLVIFDEASAIDDVIWETAEGAMTTPGAMWAVFGNPTRTTGRFRECFGKFRHRWITKQVDSRNAKMANRKEIDGWIDDYGEDSDFVRIRVRGVFPRASSQQFISEDLVNAAINRPEQEQPRLTPVVLGVDVARYGDDQSVILLRAGNDVVSIRKFREKNNVEMAGFVAEEINNRNPDAVLIDGGGVGGGVIDILKDQGFKVIEVQAGATASDTRKYANVRAEMWGRMKEWLASGRVKIPDDQQLKDDLTGIEYTFNLDNQIQLEKKEEMKKRGLASPDLADALAQTFARRIASRETVAVATRRLPETANTGSRNSTAKRLRELRRRAR